MNKGLWLTLLAALSLVLTVPASAKTYTLTYANQNPEMGWGTQQAFKPWKEAIEKASNGQIQIKGYHSQTLAKGPDTRKQ